MKHKICTCDIDSALFNDFGLVKCQYCCGVVSEERAKQWIEYNTPIKEV